MTTINPPTKYNPETVAGDRYERLTQAAEVLAMDRNLIAAPLPYDSGGLRAFAGLLDADADR